MKPRKRKYSKLIETIAAKEGVSAEEVYKEIERSIEESRRSELPSAKAFWDVYPKGQKPSPEEFILYLTKITEKELKNNN